MSRPTTTILRRTVTSFGAVAAAAAAIAVHAQAPAAGTIQLSNGQTCTFSKIETYANGGVYVICGGGGGGSEATFAIDAPGNLPVNDYSLAVKVRRISGVAGKSYTLTYSATGSGCGSAQNPNRDLPLWADGQQWDVPLVTNGTNGGTCMVAISLPANTSANPPSRTINVGSTGGGGDPSDLAMPPTPAGCPAPASGARHRPLELNDSPDQLRMASGQVATYKVKPAPNPSQSVLVEFTQGQQPSMPSGTVKTEFTISRCPGVIETNLATECKYASFFANSNKVGVYTEAVAGKSTQAGYPNGCLAPLASQDYYVNVRWTYGACSWGNGCGFSMQWASTGSNGF